VKLGHLRRLLERYSDECELQVELAVPLAPEDKIVALDPWLVHGLEHGTALARGTVVANEFTHCGGVSALDPDVAIIEVDFGRFDVTVKRKTEAAGA